ncbi:hypothetical protein H8959_006062 [Pygathrix nigripes]
MAVIPDLALPHLRKSQGNVINISSLVGAIGQAQAVPYVATKIRSTRPCLRWGRQGQLGVLVAQWPGSGVREPYRGEGGIYSCEQLSTVGAPNRRAAKESDHEETSNKSTQRERRLDNQACNVPNAKVVNTRED